MTEGRGEGSQESMLFFEVAQSGRLGSREVAEDGSGPKDRGVREEGQSDAGWDRVGQRVIPEVRVVWVFGRAGFERPERG
jgi:hypothetical protein